MSPKKTIPTSLIQPVRVVPNGPTAVITKKTITIETPVLTITTELETDGRWLGSVEAIPGVMAYGSTPDEARKHAYQLALRTIADRIVW